MSVKTQLEILESKIKSAKKKHEQVKVALAANVTLSIVELNSFYLNSNDVRDALVRHERSVASELAPLEYKLQRIEELLSNDNE
tara:strand:+ start:305 stop:556 length:252 start_codon:yes stop_codon:yes gene_type:complete